MDNCNFSIKIMQDRGHINEAKLPMKGLEGQREEGAYFWENTLLALELLWILLVERYKILTRVTT